MRRFRRRVAIALAILASIHAYIWWRFVAITSLPTAVYVLATLAILVLAPSMLIASIAMRRVPRARAAPWLWLAYTWFGCATYLLLAAALSQVAAAVFPITLREAAAGGVAAVVAVVAYGLIHARRGPFARRLRVPLSGLPAAAEGYRIVQLTDTHIGWALDARFAASVVDKVNALAPDLIVLTGDLVDGHVHELAPHVEPFRELSARDGVYAVTGNHEYYWDADAWIAHLGSLGLRFLRNERVRIGDAFELAGVNDVTSATVPGHGEDVARALAGRDPALPVVLLAHHPSSIARAAAADVALQLSGHTHGGQLLPLGWLSRLFEPHVAGLARFGTTWLYVSEGTGFWGPPLRVGTSCEIAVIELIRAGDRGQRGNHE